MSERDESTKSPQGAPDTGGRQGNWPLADVFPSIVTFEEVLGLPEPTPESETEPADSTSAAATPEGTEACAEPRTSTAS